MLKHFRIHLAYRILSIFLAMVLWFYVTEEKNPATENVVTVPLELRGLRTDLVIADKPNSVNVRLQGRKAVVTDITSREIKAFVDLKDATVGRNLLPVQVSLPPRVQLVEVAPSLVEVDLDRVSEAQLPVTVKISGGAASGYSAQKPYVNPTEVLVRGPKNVLDNIGEVYVDARLQSSTTNYLERLPLKISDKWGNPLHEWVSFNPPTVEVFIPVVESMPSRSVALKVELQGQPAKGYKVERVIKNPEFIKLFGPYELLQQVEYLTVTVDVTGATGDVETVEPVPVPAGLQNAGAREAQIVVKVVPGT